jgi:predicted O-methyltransferase YrrM
MPLTPFLEELEKRAVSDGIPIIRKSARSLLRYVLASKRPDSILEVGTAVAFSAIFMATYGSENVHIDTIENYAKRIEAAKQNIADAKASDRINLIEGDALEILEDLVESKRSYDMIFIDAAKAQYPNYLPLAKKLLRNGGILVSDNVLFDGDIVLSRFAVRRRDRTIHARMREYLRMLSEDEELVTTILPVADGMTLSVKTERPCEE